MGLFDFLFKKKPDPTGKYEGEFRTLTGYEPRFTAWDKNLYESELIRAAIGARATHISKLSIQITGAARPALQRKLKRAPNELQTWSQFLYRLSTILDMHNTAFIVPVYDQYGEPSGIYAPLPERCEVVQYGGKPYLKYTFQGGKVAAIEMIYCGILTKYQYRSDFFGENNSALNPTMDLVHIQNQGIEEGVKSAATYRFMATLNNFSKIEDLKKERERFSESNFAADSKGGGLLLFPNTYANVKQIEAKPFTADAEQMKIIRENVFEYFGVNEEILQNEAYGDKWSAFYEGVVEAFAIQFSDVMTRMLFTIREQTEGNRVTATANRLQYMSNKDKLDVSAQMADRGLMTRNEIREIWNLAPLPEPYGSQLPVRGEYYNVGEDAEKGADNEPENNN